MQGHAYRCWHVALPLVGVFGLKMREANYQNERWKIGFHAILCHVESVTMNPITPTFCLARDS